MLYVFDVFECEVLVVFCVEIVEFEFGCFVELDFCNGVCDFVCDEFVVV